MAMISDEDYVLQAIRLSALRYTEDAIAAKVISLDPSVALNPYVASSGLADIDRWPEITRALDSPEPEFDDSSAEESTARKRGLKYTQTIMGSKSGGAGMRVTGRRTTEGGRAPRREIRTMSTRSPADKTPLVRRQDDDFFRRPRAGSAPQPFLDPPTAIGSVIESGRGMGTIAPDAGVLEHALSFTDMTTEDGSEAAGPVLSAAYDDSSLGIGQSARPSDLAMTVDDDLGGQVVDEGSDVGEDELDAEGQIQDGPGEKRRSMLVSRRSSMELESPNLEFSPVRIASAKVGPSALTMALNKHIPHLVSTATAVSPPVAASNPFASLYTSVVSQLNLPSISLQLYFPHSDQPTLPIPVKVRKDATVEEVTGYGLYRYWEDRREPLLDEEDDDEKLTTIAWGLRIVEDEGEVDEDFPPLDRDGQISRFSYGEFAIVRATEAQSRQNAAKAPLIIRRPSRIIAGANATRPAQRGRPNLNTKSSSRSFHSNSSADHVGDLQSETITKSNVVYSSNMNKPVLLKVRVAAGADVQFTTTISVSHDMYVADLTEVLVRRKRLPLPATDWVLCLADFSLALPLDRTVASLEGKTSLALVKKQWAVEHGLKIGDRRGGDPSASIFKRVSEPVAGHKFGPGLADFSQTYKKYTVQRKMPIGRHERVLAIDGDYIHIMPSESRTFFDSTKTTSFHISLVASCKLTGRAGGFKINVWRDAGQKRYEFDAENGKQAADIISSIRALMKQNQDDTPRNRVPGAS